MEDTDQKVYRVILVNRDGGTEHHGKQVNLGDSLVQLLIAVLSLSLSLLTAVALGYTLVPGTLGFIFLTLLYFVLGNLAFRQRHMRADRGN